MEFVRSSDDCYAGYLQDDSDLEFSECSDDVRFEWSHNCTCSARRA